MGTQQHQLFWCAHCLVLFCFVVMMLLLVLFILLFFSPLDGKIVDENNEIRNSMKKYKDNINDAPPQDDMEGAVHCGAGYWREYEDRVSTEYPSRKRYACFHICKLKFLVDQSWDKLLIHHRDYPTPRSGCTCLKNARNFKPRNPHKQGGPITHAYRFPIAATTTTTITTTK